MLFLLFAACSGPDGGDTAALCDDSVGNICTWAGNGDVGYDGGGNDRLSSMFYWPMDVEFSPYGDPVISDFNNHKLRLVEDDEVDVGQLQGAAVEQVDEPAGCRQSGFRRG